jgi:hypothetical protein
MTPRVYVPAPISRILSVWMHRNGDGPVDAPSACDVRTVNVQALYLCVADRPEAVVDPLQL